MKTHLSEAQHELREVRVHVLLGWQARAVAMARKHLNAQHYDAAARVLSDLLAERGSQTLRGEARQQVHRAFQLVQGVER